jgi:hypothetical protein
MIRFDSIIFDDDTINDWMCASNIATNGCPDAGPDRACVWAVLGAGHF